MQNFANISDINSLLITQHTYHFSYYLIALQEIWNKPANLSFDLTLIIHFILL